MFHIHSMNNKFFILLFILGVHFKKEEDEVLQDFVMLALKVFFHAVDEMLHESIGRVNDDSNG